MRTRTSHVRSSSRPSSIAGVVEVRIDQHTREVSRTLDSSLSLTPLCVSIAQSLRSSFHLSLCGTGVLQHGLSISRIGVTLGLALFNEGLQGILGCSKLSQGVSSGVDLIHGACLVGKGSLCAGGINIDVLSSVDCLLQGNTSVHQICSSSQLSNSAFTTGVDSCRGSAIQTDSISILQSLLQTERSNVKLGTFTISLIAITAQECLIGINGHSLPVDADTLSSGIQTLQDATASSGSIVAVNVSAVPADILARIGHNLEADSAVNNVVIPRVAGLCAMIDPVGAAIKEYVVITRNVRALRVVHIVPQLIGSLRSAILCSRLQPEIIAVDAGTCLRVP